ncbi:unnamed protein product [Rotaria sordida]|uniref:Uncharacterized protein n=1 Tax=Rotaria sordida TaxID=392033 RepID=A0A814ZNI4_9BILA|nr:unnamed protein product [Rotaria sordida]CAF1528077.1 unnamed protein product [Rotaria sordida]
MISFDNQCLHSAKKKYMHKQRKLINLSATNKDTSEEDNTNAPDIDDVSETFHEVKDNDAISDDNDLKDGSTDDRKFGDDGTEGVSSDNGSLVMGVVLALVLALN